MPDAPARPATLILVVGPSGAGKDTLIAHAARVFGPETLAVARRVVTRPPSGAEDHDALDPEAFAAAAAAGRFAIRWHAHGLDYAIPRTVDDGLAAGTSVLCNVSRAIVGQLRSRYPQVATIYVDAPLAVRQKRVADRRRAGESVARALRPGDFGPGAADHVVENDGALAEGCARFEAVVATILGPVVSCPARPAER